MLDRVFRRFGYVPISTLSLVPHSEAIPLGEPLHRVHADGFQR